MAFEPRMTIAGVMTAGKNTLRSPLSKVVPNYMAAQANKRANESAQAATEERKQKAKDREQGRQLAIQYLNIPEEQAVPMDTSTVRDLVYLRDNADEKEREKATQKIDGFASMLGEYMAVPQGEREGLWKKARPLILKDYPNLGKALPEEYDAYELSSLAAQSDVGRKYLAENRKATVAAGKQQETVRHNKAMENKQSKGSRTFTAKDGREYSLADIEKIYKRENQIPDSFDLMMQDSQAKGDPEAEARVAELKDRAANPPSMVEWARDNMGISLPGAKKSKSTGEFDYVPGKGLVPR